MPLDDEDVVAVCRIGLFQNLSPKDIMFLVRVSHTVLAEEGSVVISQNSMADFFYIIVDGLLRMRSHVRGRPPDAPGAGAGFHFPAHHVAPGEPRRVR